MIRLLKRRYIGFKVKADDFYSKRFIFNLIIKEVLRHNEKNATKIRIRLLEYQEKEKFGIIRCDHKSVTTIRNLFNSINEKNKGELNIRVLRISGSIKSLKKKSLLN